MSVKYQIFISSTYDDLKEERAAVIKAILEMGHIPVGMEMFSAADEEQWKLIARQIDETDYYVVIVGHRYGSMTGSVSYTEKEFDYAVSKGVPVYGFVVDESVQPLAKHVDSDGKRKAGLAKFTAKVKQRPVGFWRSAEELHGKVSIALMKAFNTNPRVGWTRAVAAAGPEVSQELSRLSRENADLRKQIEALNVQKIADEQAELEVLIDACMSHERVLNLREFGKPNWDHKRKTNLLEVFIHIAPEMIVEKSLESISDYLALMYRGKELGRVSDSFPIASNRVKSLMVDLHTLNLAEPSKRKHPVSDKSEYWTLTDKGGELLKLIRRKQLEVTKVAKKAEKGKSESGA